MSAVVDRERQRWTRETWKVIPGYDGLTEVSDLGRYREYWKSGCVASAPVIKRARRNDRGYVVMEVRLRSGKVVIRMVHRMVLLAFEGVPPEDRPYVLHRNDDPWDARLVNLYYGTAQDNADDRRRNSKPRKPGMVMTAGLQHRIERMVEQGLSNGEIWRQTGVGRSRVAAIRRGETQCQSVRALPKRLRKLMRSA